MIDPDIHTIRLKHPWQREPRAGGCCWSRSFNWPAGLTPREVVRVVIDGLPDGAVVRLSGEPLVADATGGFDITSRLAEANKLSIELVDPPPDGGIECPFDVRLEIDEG